MMIKISGALISVFHKEGLESIVKRLTDLGVAIYSTGGTHDYLTEIGACPVSIESVTSYPSILGGRVKTLHPKVFGAILGRRSHPGDREEFIKYDIPTINLVIVDLYPFEKTLDTSEVEDEIIEKIDIGGISLIRAAAKNFKDVLVVPSSADYLPLLNLLNEKNGYCDREDRRKFAARAFDVSSAYDTAIFHFFNREVGMPVFKKSIAVSTGLRYGENPHQKGLFYGDLSTVFDQLHGKEISFNNLGDIEAAIGLISEFSEPTCAILKHQNACGLASRDTLAEAWADALVADPVSAFGGVIITNREVDEETAALINKLFFEVLLAPGYKKNTIEILKAKKNRLLLLLNSFDFPVKQFRSLLHGVVEQDRDLKSETLQDLRVVTEAIPSDLEKTDLLFANKIVKHTRSNAVVLARNRQMLASGTGQTSRVDALKQAIDKCKANGLSLKGAALASDAFFPFADSVEIAYEAGVTSVIQPGGSVRDEESVAFCNAKKMSMVFTGFRHFKH